MQLLFVVLLLACLAVTAEAQTVPAERRPPIVGAIRWDAWHGDRDAPGKAVALALGPKQYHGRLPFFAKVISDDKVEIDGTPQKVMDQEIAYAKQAGLDYWAFVTYAPDSAMCLALNAYRASEHKQGLNFCLIVEAGRFGKKDHHDEAVDRYASLMAEPTYQKVLGDRPLLYVGFIHADQLKNNWGGPAGFREMLDELRGKVKAKGLGNPYIVIMDFSAVQGSTFQKEMGCDAISSYVSSGGCNGSPYRELASHAEKFWEACRETKSQVIPIVVSGWDRRPRIERPMPWEKWQKPGEGMMNYYKPAKPEELATHLEHGLKWVKDHPEATEPNALLIYAWNENDEGGWLVPTLGDGTARVEAVGKVLKNR